MGGEVHGMHSRVIAAAGDEPWNLMNMASMIKTAMDHLVSEGICTEVASYTSGTGWGLYGSGTPIGANGFLVYRFPTSDLRPDWFWELLIEWHTIGATTDTGVEYTPCLMKNDNCATEYVIGVQACVAFNSSDVCVSGWTGTTNFDGSDYKGAVSGTVEAVWAAPSGGVVHVWPRGNNSGGNNNTYKENCSAVQYLYTSDSHMDQDQRLGAIIADNDSFFMSLDPGDDREPIGWCLFSVLVSPDGAPVTANNFSPPNCPLVSFTRDDPGFNIAVTEWGNEFDTAYSGGAINPAATPNHVDGIAAAAVVQDLVAANPNTHYTTGTVYEEAALYVYVTGSGSTPKAGLGYMDPSFARYCYNVPKNTTFNNKARAVFGAATLTGKLSVPWDGASDPGAAGDATGVTF